MRRAQFLLVFMIMLIPTQTSFSRQFREIPPEYDQLPGKNRLVKIGNKWITPNLIGLNIDSQDFKDSFDKFKLTKKTWLKNEAKKGTVVKQSPPPDSLQDKKFDISIVISLGP